jgi:hypothetical protein
MSCATVNALTGNRSSMGRLYIDSRLPTKSPAEPADFHNALADLVVWLFTYR